MIYKKVIIILILSMLCIFSFAGCSKNESESAIKEEMTQDDVDQEMSNSYEEYEFIERDTDLDNGVDTFYYEATQIEGLITSKYDVALTYQFEMGEWNVPDIQETLTETKWDVIGTWKYEDETKTYDVTVYSVDTQNKTVQMEYSLTTIVGGVALGGKDLTIKVDSNGVHDLDYGLNSYYNPIVQMSNSGEEVSTGDSWETLIFHLKGDKLGLEVDNCWLTRQETDTETKTDFEVVNNLHKIEMYITVNEDGSANIRESWNITVEEGTEVYKQVNNMSGSSIRSLTVAEGDTTFEALSEWDVDASREDKKYKSGIIQHGDNYELCFGVGDYGEHTYVMHYTIDNFIFQYSDMYSMNSRLVNEDMNVKPDEVYARVDSLLFTADTKVYAFGFEGEIHVLQENDSYYIEAKSEGSVNYVNILSGFEGAEFTGGNTTYNSRTFADIVDEATEDSNYN